MNTRNLKQFLLYLALVLGTSLSFQVAIPFSTTHQQPSRAAVAVVETATNNKVLLWRLAMSQNDDNDNGETTLEYRNVATTFLSNFMKKPKDSADGEAKAEDPLANVDFSVPKLSRKLDLETLAACLDAELYEKEWFVTGNVNAMYFSQDFVFQDPDVRLEGIEAYARGVNKLFNQKTSRAEIISTQVNPDAPNTITCTWRLSGDADIGPGLKIKPYVVYTDFKVDPTSGLIVFQEDRFDLPQWDILLSSLFPFLIGKVTAPPAPPVEPRVVVMPKLSGGGKEKPAASAFDGLLKFFGGNKKQ